MKERDLVCVCPKTCQSKSTWIGVWWSSILRLWMSRVHVTRRCRGSWLKAKPILSLLSSSYHSSYSSYLWSTTAISWEGQADLRSTRQPSVHFGCIQHPPMLLYSELLNDLVADCCRSTPLGCHKSLLVEGGNVSAEGFPTMGSLTQELLEGCR